MNEANSPRASIADKGGSQALRVERNIVEGCERLGHFVHAFDLAIPEPDVGPIHEAIVPNRAAGRVMSVGDGEARYAMGLLIQPKVSRRRAFGCDLHHVVVLRLVAHAADISELRGKSF